MATKLPGSILVRLIGILCLFSSCLASAGTIKTSHELDAALESAVQCKPKAWEKLVESNEESGSEVFRSLGILQHSGDVETAYLLPAGTRIFGYRASKVWQVNTSVDVLYVELTAGANGIRRLKERLHMVAPPASLSMSGWPRGYFVHRNEELKALFVLACHVESRLSMESDRQKVGLVDVASELVNLSGVRRNRDFASSYNIQRRIKTCVV